MSQSTAIGMVSESLRALLAGEMRLTPSVPVTVLAPDEAGGERRINLFLYKVQENVSLKNLDWQVKPAAPTSVTLPPLSLNLFYLLTPYAANDPQTGNAVAHEILGEAMRVFYEHAVVPDDYLVAGLQDSREQIRIMLNTLNVDEMSQVWHTFSHPFRLSVVYEISVVQLDPLPASERPMAPRVKQVGVPQVQAPFHPPVVNSLEPSRGQAGTVATVRGRHLANWRAFVRVADQLVVDGQQLSGDELTVTVPAGTLAGINTIQIDISDLCRATFMFEVTP
jgi:Pvc16 N-terminal domain/IPT/TIG domain